MFVFRRVLIVFSVGALLLELTGVFLCAQTTPPLPASAEAQPPSSPVYKVFIPTDADGNPLGDYFVPGGMLREFSLARTEQGSAQDHWMIVAAKYQGTFSLNTNLPTAPGLPLQGVSISGMRAVFEIELESENATLILPPFPLLPEGSKWDGQPIQAFVPKKTISRPIDEGEKERNFSEAEFLVFSLTQQKKGKHLLELALNPEIKQVDEIQRRISFEIPKIPDAILELYLSPDMPTVTVEDSLGPLNNEPGKLTAKLGPSDRLSLSWVDDTLRTGQAAAEQEQLFWLRARPNQIDVAARYKFRIVSGKLGQLYIAADPKMQMIGPPSCDSPEAKIDSTEAVANNPGVYRIVFQEPVSGSVTIQANYLYLRNFSGIGIVRLPEIPETKIKPGKSLLAVSLDPILECDPLQPSTATIDRFQQDWGPSEDVPFAVYNLPMSDSSWNLAIRAKPLEVRAAVRQSILVRPNQSHLFFEASLETRDQIFEQTLFIPEFMEIERVEIREARNFIPVRWAPRNGAIEVPDRAPSPKKYRFREVTIFSEKPLSGSFEISVRGRLLSVDGNDRNIPILVLGQVATESCHIDIFRDPSVLLHSLSFPTSWKKTEYPGERKEIPLDGILLGSWQIPPESFAACLPAFGNSSSNAKAVPREEAFFETASYSAVPNKPVLSGRQISKLQRNLNNDRWEMVVDFKLNIVEGELNSIRLLYDENCGSTPTITPPMKWEILPAREGTGRILELLPSQPIGGAAWFSIKTTVNVPSESVALPKVALEGNPSLKHYVVLPTKLQLKPIEWDKKRLSAVDPSEIADFLSGRRPDGDAKPTDAHAPKVSEDLAVLLANGPDFSVSINARGNRPNVQLNDVNLYLRKNGVISGISSFDLRGDGADHCILTLPDEFELVRIASGGITSKGTSLSPGRWRVEIWPNHLPQKIEVIFQGRIPEASRRIAPTAEVEIAFPTKETRDARAEQVLPFFTSPDPHSLTILLPQLESVPVVETVWTMTLENPERSGPVRYFVKQQSDGKTASLPEQSQGQEAVFAAWEKEAVSALSYREAIPILLRIDLTRLSNMQKMMEASAGSLPSSRTDITRWYSYWGRNWWGLKKEMDSLANFLESEGNKSCPNTVFRSQSSLSGPLATLFGLIQTSEQNLKESRRSLQESYEKTVALFGLESQDREFAEAETLQTNAFTIFRMNQLENTSYLFGVSGENVETLQLVSFPKKAGPWDHATIRWSIAALLGMGLIFMVRGIHPRRLFRQYPFFVGTALAIVFWLVLAPGILGLVLLPLIWLAMIWPAWFRKRSRSLEIIRE